MLDLKTVLVVQLTMSALEAVAWMLIWRSWRDRYELKLLAAGFVVIAFGLFLYFERPPHPPLYRILIDNQIIKLGVVLIADGLARFLGQPSTLKIGLVGLILHSLSWSVFLMADPANLALRIYASTVFTALLLGIMIRTLYRDRSQPGVLRWVTITVLGIYIGASLLQAGFTIWLPATVENGPVLNDVNSWYFLLGNLFLNTLFLCLSFMVGMRLSAELRQKNFVLAKEVEHRSRLETELSASLEAERAARSEQRALLRMVSHEFRTPLASIRYSRDMLDAVLPDQPEAVSTRLTNIDTSLSRLTVLIDRFLTGEREGDALLEVEAIAFADLVADIQSHFAHLHLEHRLRISIEDSLPSYGGDAEMLRTVLANLLENALKYSEASSMVDLRIFQKNQIAIWQISDRGIGIPDQDLPHVGRRFFRASNTRDITGSGLGIAACKQLLHYHGGILTFSDRAGGGTVAEVRLPMPGLDIPMTDKEATGT